MKTLYNIINFEKNKPDLIKTLSTKNFDFDRLYSFCSANLMIPTLHNAIHQKKLSAFFPEDFIQATTYISNLNSERNTSILNQIQDITHVFNKNNINYVFLKGNAMCVLNAYRALSDRMIGDIDILVSKHHLEKAKHLLIEAGYKLGEYRIELKFLKHRHLPRLISKHYIAAVELHDSVLSLDQSILKPKNILLNKIIINNTPIPCEKDMLTHSILSNQINDYGYLKWDFNYKTVYDFLVISKDSEIKLDHNNKYIRRFFLTKQLHVKATDFKISAIESYKIKFLKWRLSHKKINALYIYLIVKWYTIKKLPARFFNLFINKAYRVFTYQKLVLFTKKHLGLKV